MKKDIHPQVKTDIKVKCACGNTFISLSTQDSIVVDICAKCHPFYTGTQKFIDTEGRIDKFKKRAKLAQSKTSKKSKENKKDQPSQTKTLKELLADEKASDSK